MKFSREMFISIEEEGSDNEYPSASKTLKDVPIDIGETKKVAVYTLKEIIEVKNETKVI